MPRRYWLPIIAVVGLISAAQAQQPIKGQGTTPSAAVANKAPQDKAKPPELLPLKNSIDGVRTAIEAAANKKETTEEKIRAQENLDAQLAMAVAAKKMFWVGVVESGITFAGVLLVLATLIYTKKAAHAAQEAVNVARQQMAEARQSSEDSLRPYVQMSRCKFQRIPGKCRMIVTIQNSGQSPATFFEVQFRAKQVPRSTTNWEVPVAGLTATRWNSLGGNDSVTVGLYRDDFGSIAEAASSSNGETQFWLLGLVKYGDIWGNVYETEFAYFTLDSTQTYRSLIGNKLLEKPWRKMSRAPGTLRTFVMTQKAAKQQA